MRTATHTFDTLQDLNDALPNLPVSAVITDRDGDTVPRSSLRHMVGTYAPYTVTPEAAVQSQLATALLPLADAPDIDNVPAASSMHALMECASEIHHGVRQILEAMSPEMVIERARASLPAWVEVMAEAEAMAAPSLPTQDGDDDGREAAPLDPELVKAGDTVTLAKGETTVHGPVTGISYAGGGEWDFRVGEEPYRRAGRIGLWAVTDHQPAPEPEPEWELEQVAEISFRGCHAAPLTTLRAIRTDAGWRTVNGDWADVNVESARPLVVVDPEAVDVVELAKAAWDRWDGQPADTSSNAHFRDVVRAVLAKVGLEAAR